MRGGRRGGGRTAGCGGRAPLCRRVPIVGAGRVCRAGVPATPAFIVAFLPARPLLSPLRTPRTPQVGRLIEDPLRALRAVRFAVTLGLKLAPDTAALLVQHAHRCSVDQGATQPHPHPPPPNPTPMWWERLMQRVGWVPARASPPSIR